MAVDMGSAIAYLTLDTTQFVTALGESEDSLSTASRGLSSVGSSLTGSVTRGFVTAGKAALTASSNFESAMAQVQATRGVTSDATEELNGETVNLMDAYSDLAKELGKSTKFSATEAAAAINNMAMAGYNVQETYDTLPTVLSLASAGALDLDYATQLVANGLNVMGLETKDATELADKMAVTASNAYGSVSDFGEGLLVAGGQAKLANVNLTDTMTALGILGDNGISASEGGTMLRNTLKNLYTPTTDAANALNELGIVTKDETTGALVDFQDVLIQLDSALGGLTDAERVEMMGRIFDTRTIAGASALISNSTDRWNELSGAIDNAGGAADRMAATQLDNVNGRITILKSSIEGLLISLGELLLPVFEKVVGVIQSVVDWFNNLDEGTKQTIVTIASIAAAVGPVLMIVGRVLGTISLLTKALAVIKPIIIALTTVLSGPVGVILAIVAAVTAAIVIFKKLYAENEAFRNAVDNIVSAVKQFVADAIAAFQSFGQWVSSVFTEIGVFFTTTVPAWIDSMIAFFKSIPEKVSEFLTNAVNSVAEFANSVKDWFVTKVPEAIDAVRTFFEELPFKIGVALGKALRAVVDWVTNLYNTVKAKIPVIINSVINFFSQLPGKIWDWLVNAYNNVVSWVSDTASSMSDGISDAIDSVVDFFSQLPDEVWTWLTGVVDNITSWAGEVYDGMSSAVSDAIDAAVTWLSELPGKFSDWFDEVIATLSGIDLSSVGSEILDSLWSGLQATWDSIKGWFDSLSLNWNKFTSGFKKGFSGGSYATGLDYVPRTMNVTVHRGERILTQQENEQFSKGGSVEVVTYQNDEAINKLSDTMNKLLNEVKELKDKQIVLDSKRLVGGLVGEMDRQLGIRAERARGVV